MYDSRISDLSAAIECGLIALTEVPALASNTFSFAASYAKDDLHMISWSNGTIQNGTNCQKVYAEAFELDKPPYTSYSFHIASMPLSNIATCDVSSNKDALCVMQSVLRLATPVIQGMESVPKVEIPDIWLNVAAIVGGVQYLAWCVQALVDAF
jgi:hypothetical protein